VHQSITSDKLVSSTGSGFRPHHASQHLPTHRGIQHSQSVPVKAAEKELPTYAGQSVVRPDSSISQDVAGSPDSTTPRSSDIRRRTRRIDLGLPHSSRPTSRVTGAGAADSPTTSAADSGSVARPTRSVSTARCTAVAAVVETTPPNVDERSRISSGDPARRVGWSHDGSDGPAATRGRDPRQTTDSADSQPLRGSDENVDSSGLPTAQNSTGGGGASSQPRPTMPQRQPTATQQRRPATLTRPSTTPKSARTTTALTMTKSVTHPSFLAMLVSGTAVAKRDASPAAGARHHDVTARTRHRDNNVQPSSNSEQDSNYNNNDNNQDDDDDDDEEDEMKRQRIHHWLQHLETVVLDRPSTPIIDEDVPPQTDTAIHIIYDGD